MKPKRCVARTPGNHHPCRDQQEFYKWYCTQWASSLITNIEKNKETSNDQTQWFFVVNRCNKNSAVISKPLHAETDANRNLHVTTKPEVLQASLGSTNLQDNTASITDISTEAPRILHQNIQGLRGKSNEVINSLYAGPPHILFYRPSLESTWNWSNSDWHTLTVWSPN